MPSLTVPGANSEPGPDLEEAAPSAFPMTLSLYSILHSQGLSSQLKWPPLEMLAQVTGC